MFLVRLHLAALEPQEELGVLLVSEAVGGDVIGIERDRALERVAPLCERLAGDAEDEVEIDVRYAGLAQDEIGALRLGGGVNTAERPEQFLVPRLHAHADAIDTEIEQNAGLLERNGRGIHLERPFGHAREIDSRPQPAEQELELRRAQGARGAAAEKNGARSQHRCVGFRLAQHGVEEGARAMAVAGFLVEAAVRTHLRAEGNMRVEMLDHGRTLRAKCGSREKGFRVEGRSDENATRWPGSEMAAETTLVPRICCHGNSPKTGSS